MAGLKVNKKVVKEVKLEKEEVHKVTESEKVVSVEDRAFDDVKSSVDSIVNDEEEGKEESKSKIKLIVIGGAVLLVMAVGVVTAISIPGVNNEDMAIIDSIDEVPVVEEETVKEDGVEDVTNDDTVTEESNDIVDSSDKVSDKYNKVVYENGMLGLALKYPSNWYVEERSDILLNMVQSTNVSGNIDLAVDVVKLAGVVIDFSARDDLSTKVSLGVSPLVISGDTEVVEIQSLSDILNVGTASQIDTQIKKNIEAGGGTLLNAIPSVLKDVNGSKIIESKYQFEKNGIKMDVIQMLLPYGQNNIILTATSKIGENPINKEEVLLDMIGSVGKIGEVELTDSDKVNQDSQASVNSQDSVDKPVDTVTKEGSE